MMKVPICPLLLYFKGDEYKCNNSKCNYDRNTKTCTMKCTPFNAKMESVNLNKQKRI
jgi:hypothetical protein